jgi:hypothetical protein
MFQQFADGAEGLRRRQEQHQPQPADRGIEQAQCWVKLLRGAFRGLDVTEPSTSGILAQVGQHAGGNIARNYATGWPNALGGQQALVPGSAGDIENPHSGPDLGHIEKHLSRFAQSRRKPFLPLSPAGRRCLPGAAQFAGRVSGSHFPSPIILLLDYRLFSFWITEISEAVRQAFPRVFQPVLRGQVGASRKDDAALA